MPELTVAFRYCTVELYRDRQLVVTHFEDGTEAHAAPHETSEYHAHAIEKTSVDDVLLYCWQHELWHIIHAELRSRPSVVLWAVAHGESTDTPECQAEERETQELQKLFQMNQGIALHNRHQSPGRERWLCQLRAQREEAERLEHAVDAQGV